MKKCAICKQEKELSEFNYRNRSQDKLQTQCRECGHIKFKNYYYKNHERHIKKVKERNKWYIRQKRDIVNNLKKECIICFMNDPDCIDFHHLKDKKDSVSALVFGGLSISNLMKEIDKCVCLCSNCHRRYHAKQFSLLIDRYKYDQ